MGIRRLATTLIAVLCVALPSGALAADVDINNDGYSPPSFRISPGASVIWHYNNSTQAHGVQFGTDAPDCQTATALTLPSDCPSAPGRFDSPGRYTYHDPGCDPATSSSCITGVIVVYVPPTSSFTAGPNPHLRGQAVNFDGRGSSAPGGSLTSYAWDFGDGTGASGSTASHAYQAAGTYTVRLTVTDDQGTTASSTAQLTVTVPDSDSDGFNDDVDQCPNDPGIAPNGCPLVVPPIPAPIATSAVAAPDLSVAALKSGVTTVLSCSDTCTAVLTLTRSGKPVGIPVTAKMGRAGSQLVTIRFTRAAKRSLAKAHNPKLVMRAVVTDALGRTQTQTRGVVLKVVKTYGKLPAIGISDNQPTTFSDPKFQVLKLRYARLVEPWDGIFTEPDRLDAWLQAVRAQHIRPLISFEHPRGMVCPGPRCKGPSRSHYAKAWKAFHRKYPWVRDISPWNEVNSATQPTGRHPEQAAGYYNVVRASCRGCTIVAADLLDSSNIRRYAASFLRKAKGKPRLWGLHNYTDTNRFRSRGTKALLQSVKGTVWLTETGGVVSFVTDKGKVALPRSESRARRAMDYMFRLAEQNATRIKRIYVYQWKINNVFDRFDAGVMRPDGTPRPSYDVLTLNASIASKR